MYNPFRNDDFKLDAPNMNEAGFDESSSGHGRLINPDGYFNIKRKGGMSTNAYERFIEMPWSNFMLIILVTYFVLNAFFALGFMLIGTEEIFGLKASSPLEEFMECLFFSFQTFTTVGYGYLNPQGMAANILASFVSFFGLLSFALITGLSFAKFSKPESHIIFSKNILIAPNKEGKKSLQFRIVNGSNSTLIDMSSRVTLTWIEKIEGVMRRKFIRLDLEMDNIHLFPLNWTVVHPLDHKSPLHNLSKQQMVDSHMEILVLVKGFDDIYSQIVFKKHSYSCSDLIEGAKFKPMYIGQDEKTILDIDRLDNYEDYVFDS